MTPYEGQMSADLMDIERVNVRCSMNTQLNSDDTHSSTELPFQQGLMEVDIKLEPSSELSECSASQQGLIDIKLELFTELGKYDLSSSACESGVSFSDCKYDVSSSDCKYDVSSSACEYDVSLSACEYAISSSDCKYDMSASACQYAASSSDCKYGVSSSACKYDVSSSSEVCIHFQNSVLHLSNVLYDVHILAVDCIMSRGGGAK